MTNEALLDPQTQKIITRYTTLYKLIFQYSLFFIPLILGLIWAFSLQTSDAKQPTLPTNGKFSSYTNINGIYKATRVSDQIGPILGGLGDIKILGGELQATGGVIIGRNNLITLKNIMLPNKTYIIDTEFSGTLQTFDNTYSLNDLKRVLDNWILSSAINDTGTSTTTIVNTMFVDTQQTQPTNMEEILDQLKQRMFFNGNGVNPITQSATTKFQKKNIITDYNLSCLNKRKIYNGFCNTNLARFIEQLPDIELDNSRDDIHTIAYKINGDDQKNAFCANIMANVLKKPYPSSELDSIMGSVCIDYNARYNTIKDFLKIQNELNSIVSDSLINNNIDLNLFKLVSLQQKITQQNNNKQLDTSTVTAYLKFLEALVRQTNMPIPQFYIDASYYFNNTYLKTMLRNLATSSLNPSVKNDVNSLTEQINSLNKGNASLGIRGLEKMIRNQETLQVAGNSTSSGTAPIMNFDQLFTDTIKSFPDIRATSIQTNEIAKTARASGTYKFSIDNSNTQNIAILIDFVYKEGAFAITAFRTPYNSNIDKLIASYLDKNPNATLDVLLEVIKNNSTYNNSTISICDVLQSQQKIKVVSCDTSKATITVDTTNISFTIKNNTISDASTSNSTRQTYLKNVLSNGPITIDRLGNVVQSLATPEPVKEDTISTIDTEKITIIGKFKTFIGVEPTAVVFKNNKWFATFSLKGYDFATVVDIKNNYKLSPLVTQIGSTIVTIPNFSLSLIPFSQTRITQFIDAPLEFIKTIDTKAYNQIKSLEDKK